MIDHQSLMLARRRLRQRAGRQFPDLTAADIDGPSLQAALQVLDIDVDDAVKFVDSVMKQNRLRLADRGIVTPRQQKLYAAAMINGIAIGVLAADLEEPDSA